MGFEFFWQLIYTINSVILVFVVNSLIDIYMYVITSNSKFFNTIFLNESIIFFYVQNSNFFFLILL